MNAVLARLRDALARVPPKAILLVGWGLCFLYSYPGFMSWDSVDQLLQARQNHFRDWHPPLMAHEWQLVELVVSGPVGMLVIQTSLFLIGIYLLIRRVTTPRAAAVAASLILLFPPVLVTLAAIWKDSQMAAFLALGAGLVYAPGRRARLGGYLALFVACGMRYNAAAAVLPITLHALWSMVRPRWQRVAAAFAITGVMFVGSAKLNGWLTDEHTYPWHNSLAIFDIAGVIKTRGPTNDAQIREELDGVPLVVHDDIYKKIVAVYDAHNYWYLVHGDDRIFDPPTTPAQRHAIADAWERLVLGNPGTYVLERWRVFYRVLGMRTAGLWNSTYHEITEKADWRVWLHHNASPSSIQSWSFRWLDYMHDWTLFRPLFYFYASILALVVCAYRRRGYEVALLASGLCYELGFFIGAPAEDNRYSHWMFVCFATAGAISLLTARRRARRSSMAEPASP